MDRQSALETIVLPFLMPIRRKGNVDEVAFIRICEYMDELALNYKEQDSLPKDVIGDLVYVYRTMCVAMQRDNYSEVLPARSSEYFEKLHSLMGGGFSNET